MVTAVDELTRVNLVPLGGPLLIKPWGLACYSVE